MHREMRNLYTWPDVARRTEVVYDKVRGEESSADIYQRIPRWFIKFYRVFVKLRVLFLSLLDLTKERFLFISALIKSIGLKVRYK